MGVEPCSPEAKLKNMQAHGIQATATCQGGTSPVTVASLHQAHAQLDIGPANDLPGRDLHHSGKEAGALRGGLQADRQAGSKACGGPGKSVVRLSHQRSMKQHSKRCSSETVPQAYAGPCRQLPLTSGPDGSRMVPAGRVQGEAT